ncbi:unnamed protein product [Boreogadus saida]
MGALPPDGDTHKGGPYQEARGNLPQTWRPGEGGDGSPYLQAAVAETPADDSVIWPFQVGRGSVRNRRRGASNCGSTSALEELKLQTPALVQGGVEIERGAGAVRKVKPIPQLSSLFPYFT